MSKIKYAIGIDFGGTNIRGAIVSSEGKILKKTQTQTDAKKGSKKIIKKIEKIILKLLKFSKEKNIRIIGIGIGAPGPINFKKGEVYNPPNLPGWKRESLKEIFKKNFNLPVELNNDANCALLGEIWQGGAKNFNKILMLTLGTGVGGTFFNNKKFYTENHGLGLGHIKIKKDGKKCNCGKSGCLEAYISSKALRKEAQNQCLKIENVEDIFSFVKKGNPKANKIINEMIENMVLSLNILIKKLHPQIIILGGGIMKSKDIILPKLRNRINNIEIMPSKLRESAGMLGAAKLIFD